MGLGCHKNIRNMKRSRFYEFSTNALFLVVTEGF